MSRSQGPQGRTDVPAWLERYGKIALGLLLIGFVIYVLVMFVLRVQFITIAVVIGFAEVSLLWPVVRWLRDHRVPQTIAAILCVVVFLSLFIVLLVLVVAQVIRATPQLVDQVVGAFNDVMRWIRSGPFGVDDATVQDILRELQSFVTSFVSDLGSGVAAGLGVVATLITIVLVATFFAIFALASGDRLWFQFTQVLPPAHRLPATAAFRAAMQTTGSWFYASVVTGLADGFFIGLGLSILGVPLAVAIGALTFLLAFIPLIGATIAGVVAVAVALFSGGLTTAIWALVIVLGVQQLEGSVLSPLLMGRAVRFPPLVILIMTTTAASLFGLAGLFLAVPVTGAVVAAVLAYRKYQSEAGDGPVARAITESADKQPESIHNA
ncbi:MAG: AI-2E family transporter [Actinomycetota bacterium]